MAPPAPRRRASRAGPPPPTDRRADVVGRLRFLTAGESHGPTLSVTLEGIPAGLALSADQLAVDLARRQRGYGRGARQAIEQDRAEILAGVRHGTTLGSPILLLVANRDWENWTRVMQVEALSDEEAAELEAAAADGNKRATPVTRVRPGHADLAGALKYGFRDVRNVLERASARETAARVAAGGVARAFLRELGVEVWSFTAEVGGVAVDPARATLPRDEADASPLRCPDPEAEAAMIARIDEARSNGDTIGGVFEVVAHGLPIGLGSVRPVGPPARRRARRGGDEHQHRQGRRVRAGVRADAPVRIGRPRRHRGARRGRALDPPDQQRRRADRRRHERRATRRPRGGEADLDPGEAAAVGRPADRRGGREGPLRAIRHQRRAGRRRRRRGDGDARPGRCDARQVRRRLAGGDARQPGALSRADLRADVRPHRRSQAAKRAQAGTTRPMDVVLVGLPGSGKSAVGRRLAHRHDAAYVDLDETIERAAGRKIPEIFAEQGEAAFRSMERAAVVESRGARPGAGDPSGRRHRRRRGRRPAEPLGALPRPPPDLARRQAGGPRPATSPKPQRPPARHRARPDRGDPQPRPGA